MKIIVTGAAGFIGAHVAKYLAEAGNEIFCLDNFSNYYSIDFKKARIENLLSPNGIKVENIDLCDREKIENYVRLKNPEMVIHLAAQAGVRLELSDSHKYTNANLSGFSNILQSTVLNEVPYFIYASSSSVYGDSTNHPYKESELGLKPLSFYGATKLSNEILAEALTSHSKTKSRGLRFFTVYGPWGRPDMAYFRLIQSLLNKTEFTLFGDGTLRRDFTFIDDAVESIYLLSQNIIKNELKNSDIVNIGGGRPYSMNQLIEIVNTFSSEKLRIRKTESFNGDVKETIADSAKLKDLTGYVPLTSLEEGMSKVFEWANNSLIRSSIQNWIS